MSAGKVLVIDDDAQVRAVLALVLTRAGHACATAGSGRDGIRAMQEEAFDCVVCDYSMQDLSGEEVLEHARAARPTLPVIIVTGCAELPLALHLMRKGAFDFLSKPVLSEPLIACVGRAVRHRALLEENRRLEQENRTYQRQLERKVIEQTFQISTQGEFVNRLNALQSLDAAVALVSQFTRELLGCSEASLLLRREEGWDLIEMFETETPDIAQFEIPPGEEILFRKLAQDRIVCGDAAVLARLSKAVGRELGAAAGDFRPVITALNLEGLPFGILVLRLPGGNNGLNEREAQTLRFVADSASIAVHNQLSHIKLEKGYIDTVKALALAVEAKDPYTRGHSDRVRLYAEWIGRGLSLPEKEIRIISFAGILHDIGKIGVPIELLHKRTKLDDAEFAQVMKHPVIGENLVRHIAFLLKVRSMIRHHHERWDGKGYPDRVKGESICLGARILAVADTFDAMTTDRPYRKAFEPEVALEELVRCAGRQFDRNCVRAMLDVPLNVLRQEGREEPGLLCSTMA